jgi:hypothetical protein
MERDDLTFCSTTIVELWITQTDGDEDENDVQDTSGYEISGVHLARLGWDDLVSVGSQTGLGLVPAIAWMVN